MSYKRLNVGRVDTKSSEVPTEAASPIWATLKIRTLLTRCSSFKYVEILVESARW
jgi:hypothetical protein